MEGHYMAAQSNKVILRYIVEYALIPEANPNL